MNTAHPASPRAWAAAGTVAALAGLALGHLAAAATEPRSAPLSALSDLVVARSPAGFTRWAIDTFGTADKPLLVAGLAIGLAAVGALAGLAWRRHPGRGVGVFAACAAIGTAAAVTRPGLGAAAAVPSILAAALAALGLVWWDRRGRAATVTGRRGFLWGAAAVAAAAVGASWWAARVGPAAIEADRESLDLPAPDVPAVEPGPVADFDVQGLAPYRTPNRDFYRIDTAITVPRIDVDAWRLRVHGMVDRELTFTFDDLLGRELIERDITLCCVSNRVGGDLVGNARWLGVSLADLLAEAGPDPAADQLVSRSDDGWTAGSPADLVFDGRDAMIALGMNGRPLPVDHGWPARLVVPGLYGYVSATKWLTELELTTFDAYDAYWITRGWSTPRPVKTASRIDTPRSRSTAGTVVVAGVAWAQHRGIAAVELQIDNREWQLCALSDVATTDTWRQWRFEWDAAPGEHRLTVRATDGDGNVQTSEVQGVAPDGATGLHSVTVAVE
ncbi:molybdopterin-dependent oxidoreductase [Glycomyces sp. TRM65418]|uniref:molybdopterin-dependent oxidoreductase n=1 Tax=Glycomyces sp. TRM65418 TaxID=2867006 RepID=UPI001CE58557|nr:molybdopterin-dependent oxidoreductase [Glycomyces sp. TRM65418]MCC3763239.1 molybdopterin-dependent oxidoreductase [Glycomyces sp. TRM65418]QZD57241.1 molybdopterin-dependent oxidoreductase [Glycomyces sp. TRM65418]